MRNPFPLLFIFATFLSAATRADEPAKVKICVGAFTAEGLAPEVEAEVKRRLLGDLETLGAEVLTRSGKADLDQSCFGTPTCLRAEVDALAVAGVLDVQVIRLGPMVRIAIRTFDAVSGAQLGESASMASERGFPENLDLREDLARSLGELRRVAAARVAAAPAPVGATPIEGLPPTPAATPSEADTAGAQANTPEVEADAGLGVVAMSAAGAGLLFTVAGLGALGYELFVLAPEIGRRHTTSEQIDGQTVVVVEDRDAYVEQAQVAQLLWFGGWGLAAVGIAALSAGGALFLLGADDAGEAP